MKKKDTDIQDIYRSEDRKPEAQTPWKMPEQIERELFKRRLFYITVGILTLTLTVFLVVSISNEFLFSVNRNVPSAAKPPRLATYTLPPDDQWAIEYRQAAEQAENSEVPGAKPFSTKWVKNAAYHLIMGEQAVRLQDLPAAQRHLETALETFPALTGAHHLLGEVYLRQQYFDKAVEQLQQALAETPSIDVLNNLGVAYLGVENYAQAESCLRQAVQQQPDLAGCYKNLVFLYQKTGRTNEAVAAYEKYFSLNPKDTALIQNYTDYLTSAGRVRDAINFLERAKSGNPLPVNLLLARTAAQDNDEKLAVRALREATRFLTPRQTIAEMHDPAFEKIAGSEDFRTLLHRLELSAVTLSTNLNEEVEFNH